jgi:thiol:disulfide interchange protein DsbD
MRTRKPADSLRRTPRAAAAPVARRAALVGSALVAVLGLNIGAAAAEIKLLPTEEAFRYAARAVDARTLEARFTIADGYYLYRDKLRFGVEPEAVAVGAPALPPGKLKDDEFFGRVETYRAEVVVRIPVEGAVAGQTVTLRADSQGCADAGVCYPPVSQRIVVVVPAAGAPAGPYIEATPAKKRWFQ